METLNAFIGKTNRPSPVEVADALGSSAPAWSQFLGWMAAEQGVSIGDWRSTSPKHGWSLRLKLKDRTIVYLAPCGGCLRASFVLGPRAINAARHICLPPEVMHAIDTAPHYTEGTGVRLLVKEPKDLVPIRALAEIKLASRGLAVT